jgi:hypothetical protein
MLYPILDLKLSKLVLREYEEILMVVVQETVMDHDTRWLNKLLMVERNCYELRRAQAIPPLPTRFQGDLRNKRTSNEVSYTERLQHLGYRRTENETTNRNL